MSNLRSFCYRIDQSYLTFLGISFKGGGVSWPSSILRSVTSLRKILPFGLLFEYPRPTFWAILHLSIHLNFLLKSKLKTWFVVRILRFKELLEANVLRFYIEAFCHLLAWATVLLIFSKFWTFFRCSGHTDSLEMCSIAPHYTALN